MALDISVMRKRTSPTTDAPWWEPGANPLDCILDLYLTDKYDSVLKRTQNEYR